MTNDPLVLDLIEWVAKEPRSYAELIDAWRTSCPQLTVWEDAVERGYVARHCVNGKTIVVATKTGLSVLHDNRRAPPASQP